MNEQQLFQVMGFARYEKLPVVEPERLIEACLRWRAEFLDPQPGILKHWLLGNLKGGFADAMLVKDDAAFDAMSAAHCDDPSSQAFMKLIDVATIRLAKSAVLKRLITVPTGFSCIEFGTFSPLAEHRACEAALLDASAAVERDYLAAKPETVAHFIGKIDDSTYAEISFMETLGTARAICDGYHGNPACMRLLSMCDPKSVDLDFWYVLA